MFWAKTLKEVYNFDLRNHMSFSHAEKYRLRYAEALKAYESSLIGTLSFDLEANKFKPEFNLSFDVSLLIDFFRGNLGNFHKNYSRLAEDGVFFYIWQICVKYALLCLREKVLQLAATCLKKLYEKSLARESFEKREEYIAYLKNSLTNIEIQESNLRVQKVTLQKKYEFHNNSPLSDVKLYIFKSSVVKFLKNTALIHIYRSLISMKNSWSSYMNFTKKFQILPVYSKQQRNTKIRYKIEMELEQRKKLIAVQEAEKQKNVLINLDGKLRQNLVRRISILEKMKNFPLTEEFLIQFNKSIENLLKVLNCFEEILEKEGLIIENIGFYALQNTEVEEFVFDIDHVYKVFYDLLDYI